MLFKIFRVFLKNKLKEISGFILTGIEYILSIVMSIGIIYTIFFGTGYLINGLCSLFNFVITFPYTDVVITPFIDMHMRVGILSIFAIAVLYLIFVPFPKWIKSNWEQAKTEVYTQ